MENGGRGKMGEAGEYCDSSVTQKHDTPCLKARATTLCLLEGLEVWPLQREYRSKWLPVFVERLGDSM